MKKVYLLLFVFMIIVLNSKVGAQGYTFAASTGTFTALPSGTSPSLTGDGSNPLSDEGWANTLPIGFTFNYNSVNYTDFSVSTNGFITLGGILGAAGYTNNLSTGPAGGNRPVIAPLWDDLDMQATSNLTYAVSGSSPNRVLTVQWLNAKWSYSATAGGMSFQVKLYEGTNVIEFIYRSETGSVSSASASIGISTSASGSGTFQSLNGSSTSPTISTTTSTNSISAKPADNQLYSFTPPAGCSGTPTAGTAASSAATICNNQNFTLSLTGYSVNTGITFQWQRSNTGAGSFTNINGATTPSVSVNQNVASDYQCIVKCTNGNATATSNIVTVTVNSTGCPPECTTNLAPVNAATGVAFQPNMALSWSAAPGATSYDVYFGTTNPPTSNIGNTTATSVNVTGGLATTTYYWYVVPKNASGTLGTCSSTITSYTTSTAPPAPSNDDFCSAIALTKNGVSDCQNTVGATSTGDPTYSNSTPNNTTWYTYTPANTGAATVLFTRPSGALAAEGLYGWLAIYTASGSCPTPTFTEVPSTISYDLTTGDNIVVTTPSLTAATTYYFMIDGVSGASGKYCIRVVSSLPVAITNFRGERQGSNNVLSWTTSTETNNTGFELQRSADGVNFSQLSFITSKASNGNSNANLNYTFTDTKSLIAGSYYRLKQIDKDGKSTLSSVVFIKGVKVNKLELVSIYPNPAVDNLNVALVSPKADNVTFVVSDVTGKVIVKQTTSVLSGDNNIKINVSSLAKGTYTIKAICADGCETAISKFVKQ